MKRKLSELIREGSKMHPQAFDVLQDDYGATCAVGAAMEAAFGSDSHFWPNVESCISDELFAKIEYWNDGCGYSRERIASFIARSPKNDIEIAVTRIPADGVAVGVAL